MNRMCAGFSLIELIIFIVVSSVLAAGLMLGVNRALKGSPDVMRATTANEIARTRMEFIIGNRYKQGFNAFVDPCAGGSPPALCVPPTGYSVNATITPTTLGGDTQYKTITVLVTGLSRASLTLLVGNY